VAHAVKKLRIKYPSVESFCREYESNLRHGGLYIKTTQPSSLHDILELVLTLPELEENVSFLGEVVKIQDAAEAEAVGQKAGMAVQVLREDQLKLEELKEKLSRIEIYRTLLGLPPAAAKPKAAAAPPPKPEPPSPAPPPPRSPEAPQIKFTPASEEQPPPALAEPGSEGPKITLSPVAPETPLQTAAAPPPSPAPAPSVAQPAVKAVPVSEELSPKLAPPPPAPPRVQEAPAAKETSPELLKGEAIDFLRQAVGTEEIVARPLRQEIKAPTAPAERVRKTFSEADKKRLEPISQFVGVLVKAMLRSGYYAPEHPESKKAKQGLYAALGSALKDEPEIGLISRFTTEASDILVSGVLDEPVSLRSLFSAGAAEMFLPKLREYFERKGLVSFMIKGGISAEHFETFVDIMSDPAVDRESSSEVGHLLTEALVRNNIQDISTVFQDDMIKLGLKLPWRVEMAIQRLAKDLRTVPMFQNLSPAELNRLKARIIQDILRPLREPHLLKDMVINCYLIARHVEGMQAEELEQTLIQHFPMTILLPTSEFVFAEMKALKAELESKPDSELLRDRQNGIKRILKYISVRVIEEKVEGGEAFLENLYFQEILKFEELPQVVQDRINTVRLAQAFSQNPSYYTGKFAEARTPEDHQLFLRYWRRILPELLDARDYPNLYFFCQALTQAQQRDPEQLKKLRGEIEDEIEYVWHGQYASLKDKFLTEKKETRTGLDEVVGMLGERGIEVLVQVLAESGDRGVRKGAIDALIRIGGRSRKYIRAAADDPAQPWALQRNAIFILGQLALQPGGDSEEDHQASLKEDLTRFERFLRHSQPQLREEALTALFRLVGPTALPKLAAALDDPDPRVRRRALGCLALLPAPPADLAGQVARRLRPEEGESEEDLVKVQALKTLAQMGNVPVGEDEDVEAVILGLLGAEAGWKQKLLSRLKKDTGESEPVKLAALETLAKIGTEKSLPLLERLAKSAAGQFAAKLQETKQQIELRLQK